ncbi:MAG: type II secretion system protein [Burkholderiales bacterium]|nr:MAG: type II secretion system protein [Burkholderiales bacterium]
MRPESFEGMHRVTGRCWGHTRSGRICGVTRLTRCLPGLCKHGLEGQNMALTLRTHTAGRRARLAGFSLLELSVVLVIIATLLGAMMTGGDLLRHAHGQRIFTEFVSGWRDTFARHVALTKVVPGDNPLDPSNVIVGTSGSALLCNDSAPTLSNLMLARGISLPAGLSAGQEDRYVYQDSNGSPHELQVCFITADWSIAGSAVGVYVTDSRHLMRLTGLTTELAIQLDVMIDGRPDARFGRFRRVTDAASLASAGMEWPAVKAEAGEANIAEVEAYLEM